MSGVEGGSRVRQRHGQGQGDGGSPSTHFVTVDNAGEISSAGSNGCLAVVSFNSHGSG